MSVRARNVGLGVLVVALAVGYAATHVSIESDFSVFLPRGLTDSQRLVAAQLQHGATSRLLLIAIDNDTAPALADISRALATKLDPDPAFTYINNGSSAFAQRELEAIEHHRYVLSDKVTAGAFAADGLHASLLERLERLSGSAGMLEKSLLADDPTGETLNVLRRVAPATQPRRIDDVWFDPSGTRALLIAQTRAAGSDLAGQADALARLEDAFTVVRGTGTAQMRYSGPGAMAVESKTLIAADVRRLSLLSTALILAILVWVYRSLPVVLLCALPALCGLLLGVVAVNLWFGSVHAIALGFGATLLGEAVDYPSYLLTQVRDDETIATTLGRMLPTLVLAVATTACGSLPMVMANFPGLAQLGLLTLVGVVTAGIVTVTVLPYLIPSSWRPPVPTADSMPARSFPAFGSLRGNALALLALIAAALLFASPHRWWDDDLANMNPLPAESKALDRRLREALGAPDGGSVLVLSGASQENVLRSAENLRTALEQWRTLGDIRGFELVSDYLPSVATQASRRAALPAPERLRQDLGTALQGLPFRPATFDPFLRAVDEARQAPPLTPEGLQGTALGLKVGALLNNDADRWYVVVPLTGVKSPTSLSASVAQSGVAGLQLIELRAEAASLLASYRRQTLIYMLVGIVAIFAVLVRGLGGWRRASWILLPVACSLLLTAATLVAAGEALTIFHLVALLLTLGIGINYALFLNKAIQLREARRRTLRTLAVVAGTTLSAFGALALSRTTVLQAIGITVCVGVCFSLLVSALLLSPQTAQLGNEAIKV